MSRFFVATFADVRSAQEGIRALKDLASKNVIHLHGTAIVTKAGRNKDTILAFADDVWATAATGALIGGLAGVAIAPLAAVIFAVGGAIFGASAGLIHRDEGRALAEQVARDLRLDLAAVVAEATTDNVAAVVTSLESVGGTVSR